MPRTQLETWIYWNLKNLVSLRKLTILKLFPCSIFCIQRALQLSKKLTTWNYFNPSKVSKKLNYFVGQKNKSSPSLVSRKVKTSSASRHYIKRVHPLWNNKRKKKNFFFNGDQESWAERVRLQPRNELQHQRYCCWCFFYFSS